MNREPLTLAVSALPPELWPPGDSQPSQFSISLRTCCQNPARDRPVTCITDDLLRVCSCKTGSAYISGARSMAGLLGQLLL